MDCTSLVNYHESKLSFVRSSKNPWNCGQNHDPKMNFRHQFYALKKFMSYKIFFRNSFWRFPNSRTCRYFMKNWKIDLGFLLYLFEFPKARKPYRFSTIPFLVSGSSETFWVSDEIIRKPKRYSQIPSRVPNQPLRKNSLPKIPLWFPKILIGFSTAIKKYSRIPQGCWNRYSRKPFGFRDLGN